MNKAIQWMKSNPVSVASIAVALVSLCILGWVAGRIGSLREEAQTRLEDDNRQISRFMNMRLEIPPERPDDASEMVTGMTVTEDAIRALEQLHDRMNTEYEAVFQYALEVNQANHERLVEGLFTEGASPNVPYDARNAYRDAFRRIMDAPNPNANGPRLNAGMPPREQDIQLQLQDQEELIRDSLRPGGNTDVELSDSEYEEMRRELRQMHQWFLYQRAQQIHLYAERNPASSGYPFQIGEWSQAGDRPEPHQLWEGQLELWIQQDIARAIARANRVGEEGTSVLDAPVKRLLRVEVLPGYVGLHTLGGVVGDSGSRQSSGSVYSTPVGRLRTHELNGAVPVNFHVGPTGRVSNAMYDVRHVRLVAVVDDQRLPELFNAISATNFMTVLKCDFREVDEYEALRQGFVYGTGNAVEVNMVIETIWLRGWTQEMMPSRVRRYLGIDESPDSNQNYY